MPAPGEAAAAAQELLGDHLAARHYRRGAELASRLRVPRGFEDAADLWCAAGAAVAETYGLLDEAAAAAACVRAGLGGAADTAVARAGPEAVLAWCTAAAEWCERNGLDREFARLSAQAQVADLQPGASAAARVHWRVAAAWHHEWFGRRHEVATLLDEADTIARQTPDVGLAVVVQLKQARLALARTDPAAAQDLAARAAARGDAASTPLWLADAADVAARVAMVGGDMHRALQQARLAVGLATVAQAPPAFTFTYRLYESYALLGLGHWNEAMQLASEIAQLRLPSGMCQRAGLLPELFALVRDDRLGTWPAQNDQRLRALVGQLRQLDWHGVLPLLPAPLARLWSRALESAIEPDWVEASILSRRLLPPPHAGPRAWPWPVKLRVLGTFSCEVGGTDISLAGAGNKAAGRPLALLRHIASAGGHDGVAADAVAEALWPGEGREGRHKALEVTLARLRRLLGCGDAVLLHDRRLRLHPQRVWLDLVALAALLDQIERIGAPGTDAPAIADPWPAMWDLWRGPPLAGDTEQPGVQVLRTRWRARLGAALQAWAERPGHASRCRRALATDPDLAAWL